MAAYHRMNLKIDHIIWITICVIEVILSYIFLRSGADTTALMLLIFTFLSLGRLFAFDEVNEALFTFLTILYDYSKTLLKYMIKVATEGKDKVYSHIIRNDLQEALSDLFDIESSWKEMENYE